MARYHINRFGRFASPDPVAGSIADPQSLNRYAYVLNDPANLIDPVGLYFQNVVADPDALGKWFGMAFSFDVWHSTGGYWNEIPYADPIWVPTGFWETISFPFGGFWPGGGPGGDPIDKARNQARVLLSDKDCARFLKDVLSYLGFAPNLDQFLKEFDLLKIVPTPPGDKGVGYPTVAHVDKIRDSAVHVDVPSDSNLSPTLLHETFHTIYYGVTDYGLAKAVGKGVLPGSNVSQKQADSLNSGAASAAFDKNCKPK